MTESIIQTAGERTGLRRDYPPWEAKFADGSVISAGGREHHIDFKDAVLLKGETLEEFSIHLEIFKNGQREIFTARTRLKEAPGGRPEAGTFWLSNENAWGLPPQAEPFLHNYRVVYFRRAANLFGVTSGVTRGPVSGKLFSETHTSLTEGAYLRHVIGWQANREDGSNVTCLLLIVPKYNVEGQVIDFELHFRDSERI